MKSGGLVESDTQVEKNWNFKKNFKIEISKFLFEFINSFRIINFGSVHVKIQVFHWIFRIHAESMTTFTGFHGILSFHFSFSGIC